MPQSMELQRVRHDGTTTRTLREIRKNFSFPTEISDKPSIVGLLPLFFKPLKREGGRYMRPIYLTNWCSLLQLILQHPNILGKKIFIYIYLVALGLN